jgi:hypothetical protein
MGKVVPFSKRVHVALGVVTARSRKGSKMAEAARFNVYIDPEPDYRLRIVKRNVLHGILSSWGWHLTKGLFREIFENGGVFEVRCKASDAVEIREQIRLRLPDLRVRRVRAA